MPEIQLTPQMLKDEAEKLSKEQTRLTEIVEKIAALVNALEEGWHGKAQQAFVNSFKDKKTIYDKFASDMGTFSTFMNQYALGMEAADNRAPSGLNF